MSIEMALFTVCGLSFWQQIQETLSGLYETIVEYGGRPCSWWRWPTPPSCPFPKETTF